MRAPIPLSAVLALGLLFGVAREAAAQCEAQNLQELAVSNPFDHAAVGSAVALDGTRAVVGAKLTSLSFGALDAGAAYVFEFDGAQWNLDTELEASVPVSSQEFGTALAVDGDRIVVGAPGSSAEAACVFERAAGSWTQVDKLAAKDASIEFGSAVAVDGDVIVVGAPFDSQALPFAGAVYVFEKIGGTWRQVAQLAAPDLGAGAVFGRALALQGDRLVVGSMDAPGAPALAGSGTLLEGSHDLLSLTDARRGAAALLFFAPGEPGALPFKGGVLQAGPGAMVLPGLTDANGAIALGFDAPAGLSGTAMVLQWAIADAGAPVGVALSNGLQGRLP